MKNSAAIRKDSARADEAVASDQLLFQDLCPKTPESDVLYTVMGLVDRREGFSSYGQLELVTSAAEARIAFDAALPKLKSEWPDVKHWKLLRSRVL